MISGLLLMIVGMILDAMTSVFFSTDYSQAQPFLATLFAFNFWVLMNLRITAKSQGFALLVLIFLYESSHINTFWLYAFTLSIAYFFLRFYIRTLYQSYAEQFMLLNVMGFTWIVLQYGFLRIFGLSTLALVDFFNRHLFPSMILQIMVSAITVFVIIHVDRYQHQKEMKKQRQEYVSYRGQE